MRTTAPPMRSRRRALSFAKRLSIVTSVIRRPVPTIWVPQNSLSQEMSSFLGVSSPKTAIRLRLWAQRRWSAYDSAIGSLVPSSSAASAEVPGSGEERLPMYSAAGRGSLDSVSRWEQ